MEKTTAFYIALGSNQGNRFENLQQAIGFIAKRTGTIKTISKVYKSEAFGFEGPHFFNACLHLESCLTPETLLCELLAIEALLGRRRSKSTSYTSRTIDLDILFANNKTIATPVLKVPHPEMHKRKFVLQPLSEIASTVVHPVLKANVVTLLAQCGDTSPLGLIGNTLKLPLP